MAISNAIQTLSAAFSFGILLQAASGSLFIYYRGHGSTIFRDGRRLVLVLFLLFAALWAQLDFLNLLLPTTSSTACQATLIFSTLFDQLARVGIEQFLLWSVGHGTKVTTERLILQVILLLRIVAGGLLVGFTRPDFAPVCVARTKLLPIAIVVLVLEAVIIGVLLVRANLLGMFGELSSKSSSTRQEQSKALIFSIVGLGFWTGTSAPMILGIPTILLILRTVLPSNGLLILVGIVTMFPGALLLEREEEGTTPEARSPFVTPMPLSRELFRENVGADGSPIIGHNYTKSGNLFVVNPSMTPRDSPTAAFQSRGDTKGFTKLSEDVTVRDVGRDGPERPERPEAKNVPGYRGSSGIFPTLVAASQGPQGALAPQIRPNITIKTQNISGPMPGPSSAQQKRSLFNWSKTPVKSSARTLGISQPVALDATASTAQPFTRMATIDLATAAINERERREGAAARSRHVANRPAPRPPIVSTQEGLRRSISLKRKEMPTRPSEVMPPIPASSASGLSVNTANGSTTSASLSPGREEVRRRSPRNNNSFDQLDEKPAIQPTLQNRKTMGLPSNPRSQRITMAQDAGMVKEQTVMFMNNIVYDDPGMVKTIINGAPGMYAKRPKVEEKSSFSSTNSTTTLHSANSIIHRPRPYKRDTEKDRALFPSEPSPKHKRSKSGSSITARKSILMSNPGSPTQLPPLPPPPTSANKLQRLLPNDTKSMTFDEKIQLLFPAPPGPSSMHNRRSSVPSLPRVPSVFMSDSPQAQSPSEEDEQSRRASKRTTLASFGFSEPDTKPNSPKRDSNKAGERQTYRFSANTYRTLADEVGETWMPGISPMNIDVRNSIQGPSRSAVFDDPRKSHLTEATSSNESSQDDSITYWGSVHSEIPPVNLTMRNANETFIPRSNPQPQGIDSRDIPPNPGDDGGELMTVVLDSEENRRSMLSVSDDNRPSFFLDADQALPGDKTPSSIKAPSWHRRIGDDLPTFSGRQTNRRSRKMPPPTPLLLSKNGRQAKVIVRAAEPSPPADSPERAIKEIQAQLKRFEEPSRGSVGSLLKHMPDGTSLGGAPVDRSQLKLLENLEKEIGQQENHWLQMQTNLDRDSMSVIMSPQQTEPSETDLSRESSQRSSRTPSRAKSRRARIRSSMTVASKGQDSSRTTSTQSSDSSRASVWQQRLAEAQLKYVENAPDLLRKRSLNFLSMSKAQVGSPTPPDSIHSGTDSETDPESDSESGAMNHVSPPEIRKEIPSLWQQPMVSPKAAAGRMWNPAVEYSTVIAGSSEPPAKNVRPAQRRMNDSLPISSTKLWSKPRTAEHSRPVVGLWGSKPVRPRSIVTRRVTQRPQRKSKRVTFLPDIVESPVPLPNKRDTLGIFQFPWGETSDQPIYQPAFNPALLARPAINAKLDARSRQLEPEASEYSSSFFDDYDEEDVIDPESDDEFDETTLWEIANLLKSKDVPSKNSLLPPARGEIIGDYDENSNFEAEEGAKAPVFRLPILPLGMSTMSSRQDPAAPAALWTSSAKSVLSKPGTSLPQPKLDVWKVLVPSPDNNVRSKPRNSSTIPVLATRDLWSLSEPELSAVAAPAIWNIKEIPDNSSSRSTPVVAPTTLMWEPQVKKEARPTSGLFSVPADGSIIRMTQATPAAINMVKAPRSSSDTVPSISTRTMWTLPDKAKEATGWLSKPSVNQSVKTSNVPLLWTLVAKAAAVEIVGLFNATIQRSDYRKSNLMPAAINMFRNSRTVREPLSRLTSSNLWNGVEQLATEHHWISESSVRPDSPSIYSTSSSGRSSPASDNSSIKSSSTKASSLWNSIGGTALANVPAWCDSKSSKKSPSGSPADDSKNSSKVPVRRPSFKALALVRESRVLASRDLWESKAPVLEHTPTRKFARRATLVQQPVLPVQKPIRRQYRLVTAFRANWDEALAEAIAAGMSRKTIGVTTEEDWAYALAQAIFQSNPKAQHPVCSSEMWKVALSEAVYKSTIPNSRRVLPYNPAVLHPVFFTESLVSASDEIHPAAIGHVQVARTFRYDPSVVHPVFFTKSLVSTANEIHPAAIGHVVKTPRYDPSVLHPVFFTESFVSIAADVHPAAIGHFSQKAQNTLWKATSQTVAVASKPAMLWSKTVTSSRDLSVQSMQLNGAIVRKASATRIEELPLLHSTSFWRPTQAVAAEHNWLTSTKIKPTGTWVPRAEIPLTQSAEGNSMWSAKTTSPDIFAHVRSENVKQSSPRPGALPRLTSSELFNKVVIPESTTHWLHETSAAAKTVTRSYIWTPPLPNEPTVHQHIMWEARSENSSPSPRLFPNPHSEPWSRKKREAAEPNEIECTELWRPSRDMPPSPKHWLLKRRFSRVEFRY